MKHTPFLLGVALLVNCWSGQSRAQFLVDKTSDAKQATRCAVFYMLMSEVPAFAHDKARFSNLVTGLSRIAESSGATNEQAADWAREYMAEAVENSKHPDGNFNQQQISTCESFLASHGAEKVPKVEPPTAEASASTDRIERRHVSGRPASVIALGKAVDFDDGSGSSCEQPVKMTQASERQSRIRAQYVWLDDVHPGWKLVSRATRFNPEPNQTNINDVKIYSWFSLKDSEDKPFEACFDTTEDMLPELKALAH